MSSIEPTTLADALERIRQLEQELVIAHQDTTWGILNRNGVEQRLQQIESGYDVVVCDIDNMHDLSRLD